MHLNSTDSDILRILKRLHQASLLELLASSYSGDPPPKANILAALDALSAEGLIAPLSHSPENDESILAKYQITAKGKEALRRADEHSRSLE